MGKREEEISKINTELLDQNFTLDEVIEFVTASQDKRCYYRELAQLLGLEAAIFLTQMEFYWLQKKRNPFFKYLTPCDSAQTGDSWEEDLALSRHQINRLQKELCTRVRNGKQARELVTNGTSIETLVAYYKPNKKAIVWFFNEKLFYFLRRLALSKYPSKGMANFRKSENGQLPKIGELSYQEPLHNTKEENFTEVDEFFVAPVKEKTPKQKAREEKQREETKRKANKTRKQPSLEFLANQIEGSTMALDFFPKPSIILEAVEIYGDEDWVINQAYLYRYHCTNKKPDIRMRDFDRGFIDWWLPKGEEIRKEREKKYGTRKDANTERLDRITELTTTDIFNGKSLDELTDDLYDYYYGSGEDEESHNA